jgi:hypothetical protein
MIMQVRQLHGHKMCARQWLTIRDAPWQGSDTSSLICIFTVIPYPQPLTLAFPHVSLRRATRRTRRRPSRRTAARRARAASTPPRTPPRRPICRPSSCASPRRPRAPSHGHRVRHLPPHTPSSAPFPLYHALLPSPQTPHNPHPSSLLSAGLPPPPPQPGMPPSGLGATQSLGATAQASSASKRRRWYLGIQSKKDPSHVMTEVYKALMAVRAPPQAAARQSLARHYTHPSA